LWFDLDSYPKTNEVPILTDPILKFGAAISKKNPATAGPSYHKWFFI